MSKTRLIAMLTTLLLAMGGTTAFAQSAPSARGYDESLGVLGEIQSEEPTPPAQREEQPSTPAQPEEQGSLPFTGLDLGIVALMGLALLGTGLVLRRTTRRGTST